MIMIDPPSPFAPKSELRAFLDQYRNRPEPEIQEEVRTVEGYLRQAIAKPHLSRPEPSQKPRRGQ
jgi:hypothetical protein